MQMSMSKHFPFQQQRSKFSGSKLSNLFQCHHFQSLTKQNLDPANISHPVPKAEASEALPCSVLKVWNGKSYSLHPRPLAKCLEFRKNSGNAEQINESDGHAAWGVSMSCGAGYLGPALWLCCSTCGGISGEFPVLCFSLHSRRIGILKVRGGCVELISMKSLDRFLPHVKHYASDCSIAAARQT